jgi:DNA (cytosine-5)-methyltransferase 1
VERKPVACHALSKCQPWTSAFLGTETPTQTTRNETGLLTAPGSHMLMEYYGNDQMHPVAKAIPTISTTDRFAMITTMRGTSPEHLAASNAPTTDPFGTFSAGGQHHAVTEWVFPEIEDCWFRMLEPYEVSAGMAFVLPKWSGTSRPWTAYGRK